MLFKLYQIFVLLPIFVLCTIVFCTIPAIMCSLTGWLKQHLPFSLGILTAPDWWSNFSGRWWGRFIIWASLVKVTVTGRDKLKHGVSYVFVANHQGAYDIFLVFGFLNKPIRWVLKGSLEKVPFLGIACRHAGEIFIDRSSIAKLRASYIQAEKALQGGVSLMVFPEGRRTFTGKMSPFRRGAFAIADELQMPVVPMTINGSFEILPRQRDWHFIKRHHLTLTIHEPIYPVCKGQENIRRMSEESYKTIQSALDPRYQGEE